MGQIYMYAIWHPGLHAEAKGQPASQTKTLGRCKGPTEATVEPAWVFDQLGQPAEVCTPESLLSSGTSVYLS